MCLILCGNGCLMVRTQWAFSFKEILVVIQNRSKAGWFAVLFFVTSGLYAANSSQEVTSKPSCLERSGQDAQEPYRKAGIGERELLARLVYAEGISTNFAGDAECGAWGETIFTAIAWGVMNRVRLAESQPRFRSAFGTGIQGVIFKKRQFNPAVSTRSPFSKLMLCPSSDQRFVNLWPLAVAAVRAPLDEPAANPFLFSAAEKSSGISRVTYFYYPKSVQATKDPPSWADPKASGTRFVLDVTIAGQRVSNSCIHFFRGEYNQKNPSRKIAF